MLVLLVDLFLLCPLTAGGGGGSLDTDDDACVAWDCDADGTEPYRLSLRGSEGRGGSALFNSDELFVSDGRLATD